MSEIAKVYSPKEVEEKWYAHWMNGKFFRSIPDDREPYTIVIPPPNVTGVLHMGHMLNNTIQDVLIRRARMTGKNACWVPGTDHASIATEAKVVQMLRERGIKKSDLSRDEFLKYAWEWKDKYGGIILEQLKKLGCSCDWDRTRFTMEDELSEAVIDVFVDLYNKGHIYRGMRMVNWDPAGLTAVSDEEVIHKEVNSKLYYVRYKIVDSDDEWITIATVRPETILGDTAVCVHPDDERYTHLKGKYCIIPIVNRKVPIIFDDYIDKEFGTGALKVTPAHDINDYNLGIKHHLEVIDTLTPDGKLSEAAGHYIGEDRFVVRKKIVKDLEASGHLVKTEDYKNKVGYSERTDAVIEPRLSLQWFVNMPGIAKPALDAVINGEVKLIPDKFINTYRYWMENVKDWCISRQLWWGQRIPAWYDKNDNFVVAKTADEAVKKFAEKNISVSASEIHQDEDVLDTWFSSWLWPISVFDGFKDPNNKDIRYYYPTNDLVTAPEILFFWVARMIIAGCEYRKEIPFERVYLTGIVRDKLGRKMSKSLGNSPDPLDLISKFGADGVRIGMLLCSPAGNDLLFDESYCEQGRNFSNKMWNAFRLIKSWNVDDAAKQPESSATAIQWMNSRLSEQLQIIDDGYSKLRISDLLMTSYKLFWDDFCAWYLEMIKPVYHAENTVIDRATYNATIDIFEKLLKILHPFMPFITEELWHELRERTDKDCIIVAAWPQAEKINQQLIDKMELAKSIITEVRSFRNSKGMSPKETLALQYKSGHQSTFDSTIKKLANISEITLAESFEKCYTFLSGTQEYAIPFNAGIDSEAERQRIEKEIAYNKGFLETVMKKLGNQNFVSKAKPEVLANEEKKKADAEQKINALQAQLKLLE
ncbi:MAG: valine--tRNA ligase [Bacteroidetes bacterium]|jgi:valyl-tRNA synthetase|nr:valine--tRNA ligase [Bacteroidota bacterium]